MKKFRNLTTNSPLHYFSQASRWSEKCEGPYITFLDRVRDRAFGSLEEDEKPCSVALCNTLEMDGRRTGKPNNKYHHRQQEQQ